MFCSITHNIYINIDNLNILEKVLKVNISIIFTKKVPANVLCINFSDVDTFYVNIPVNLLGGDSTVLVLQHKSKQGNLNNNPAISLYHHIIIDPTIKNRRKNAPVYQYLHCVRPPTSNEKR